MTTLSTTRRNTLVNGYGRVSQPATDGANAISPAAEQRVREAIRVYGYSMGWHTQSMWGGFLNRLTNETPEMRRKYPEMFFREGSIKSPLLSAVWSVASLDLQVLPADKTNPRDREVADAYRYALMHAEGGVPQIVTEILLPARIRGESLCHVSLRGQVETRGKYKDKRLIHAVKAKPPGSYQLQFDDFANLIAVRESTLQHTYSPDEFIHYKWLSLEGSAGVSDLRAAVRAFEFKDAIVKLRWFYLDKLQGGFLKASGVVPQDREAMGVALSAARSGGWITTPPGTDVEVLNIAMGSDASFKSAIEDCDREMMVAVGGSHLPFSEGQGGQPRGNTQVQRQVSSQGEWKMAADLGMILTKKAKLFVDENYAGADYPEVQLGGGIDPAVAKAQVELALLVNSAAEISKDYLYEISNVPGPNKDKPEDIVPVHPLHPPAGAPGQAPGAPGVNPVQPNATADTSSADDFAFADGDEWAWVEDLAGVEGAVHG